MAEFSTHLPMMVIAEMLGLPMETREQLRHYSDAILDRSEADEQGNVSDATQNAMGAIMVLLMQIVEEKSRNLGDDIASLLLTATVRDDDGNEVALTHEQVAYRLLELTIAGHETTAKLIANGVVALDWYPDQRAELVADPSLIPNVVEEMLRWDPPSHYQGRWVEQDVTLHGVTIPADSRVILITGAANHDERVFTDPEYFDIHREIERHVGLGFGIHLCVGAALARLETRIAFEELLARYPNYELRQPMVRARTPAMCAACRTSRWRSIPPRSASLARAVEHGAPRDVLRLEEIEAPAAGPGEVRVQVDAVTLNFNDIDGIHGRYRTVPVPAPYTPGMEVLGTVDAVGDGVDRRAARHAGLGDPERRVRRLRRSRGRARGHDLPDAREHPAAGRGRDPDALPPRRAVAVPTGAARGGRDSC